MLGKIAEALHIPIYVILTTFPQWELDFWGEYFSKRPPAEDRIEILLATIAAMIANHGKRSSRKTAKDFLFFKDAFSYKPVSSGDKDVDSDIATLMAAFSSRLVIRPVN